MAGMLSVVFIALGIAASAAGPPLESEGRIELSDVAGRIDHLAIDLARNHLFVAELGNATVDVVDLSSRKVVHRLKELAGPQGIAYAPAEDLVVVACGGDGSVRFYAGADFSQRGRIRLGEDADNVRLDPARHRALVGYGDGAIAVIDLASLDVVARHRLPAHPEGFQVSASGQRIYVNLPDAGAVGIIDDTVTRWPNGKLAGNFPMALDESSGVLVVAFREPARLRVLDAVTGAVRADMATCADADDVFVDARRQRLYVACGEGVVDVFSGGQRLSSVPTARGARTALFVPELDRLFVAARSVGRVPAAILVFRPPTR
jgi:DNA-binding beta-propeller fold protein YncE